MGIQMMFVLPQIGGELLASGLELGMLGTWKV